MIVNRLVMISLVIVGLNIANDHLVAQEKSASVDSASRPNFVFILIDDMRWDTMSCAGHSFIKTPNMDRIAAKGVRFTNAFVTISLCSPSRAFS